MDFQCTQVIEDDGSSESSGYSSPNDKAQVGTLEIGNRRYAILRGLTKVGRHPACEICLEDSTVSKMHAEIEANGKNVFICDLQSSNKTRLNDAVLLPSRFYELQDGASLKFGVVEGRFFLKRPENDSILAPDTPEPGLRLRSDDSQEISVIEATPRPHDDDSFRRPTVPAHRRTIPTMKYPTPESGENLQNLETQVNSEDHLQDLETQSSTLKNDNRTTNDSDIQVMETQVGGSGQEVNDHPEDLVNIQEMETQVVNDTSRLQLSENVRKNIQEFDTQVLFAASGDDVEDDCGAPGGLKKVASGNSPGRKVEIHELETQSFNPDDNDDELEDDVPGCSKTMADGNKLRHRYTYTIEGVKPLGGDPKNRKNMQEIETQAFHPEDDAEGADVFRRNAPGRKNEIYEMETQDSDRDTDNNKLISKRKGNCQDEKSLKNDPENSRPLPEGSSIQDLETQAPQLTIHDLHTQAVDPDDNHDDLCGIYDLPTQTNFEYSETLKREKGEARVSRSQSSSPELINGPGHIIIDDSDEEDSILDESTSLSENHRTAEEANVGEGGSDKGRFKKNGIVSDSDSNDDNDDGDNVGKMKVKKLGKSFGSGEQSSKNDGKSSETVEKMVVDDSECETDFEEFEGAKVNGKSSKNDFKNSKSSKKGSKSSKNDFKNSKSLKNNFKKSSKSTAAASDDDNTDYEDLGTSKSTSKSSKNDLNSSSPAASEDDTDFEEDSSISKIMSKSSKADLKNSKSSIDYSKSSKSARQLLKVIPASSEEDTDFEDNPSKSSMIQSTKASYIISDSEDDEKTPEKSLKTSGKCPRTSSPDMTKISSTSSKSSGSPEKLGKIISISSESSEGETGAKKPSKSLRISQESSKYPPENHSKSSRVPNGHSEVVTIDETPEKPHQVIENSSGSDTDFEEPAKLSKSSKHDCKNSKSSMKSPDAFGSVQGASRTSHDNSGGEENDSKIPEKSSKNQIKNVDTSDLPPDVLRMIQSTRNSEDDGPDDDDDPYSAPTQLIVQPKRWRLTPKVDSNNLCHYEDEDEDLIPTQKIDMETLKNQRALDFDDMDPTQVIPMSSGQNDDGDLEPTQKINCSSSKTRQIMDFDDMEPTQLILKSQRNGAPGPSRGHEDDFEVIDPDKTQSQYFDDDSSSKKRQVNDDDDQNRKRRMGFLNDSDSCQVIDVEGLKRQHNLQKMQKNAQDSGKSRNSTPRKFATIPSSDSEDLENVPEENSHLSKITKLQKNPRNLPETPKNPQKSKNSSRKDAKPTPRKLAEIPSSDSEDLDNPQENVHPSRPSRASRNSKKPHNSYKNVKPVPKISKTIAISLDSEDLDDAPKNNSHPPRALPETSKNPQKPQKSSRNIKSAPKITKTTPPSDSEDLDNASKDNSYTPRSLRPPKNPQQSQKKLQESQNLSRTLKKIPKKSTLTPQKTPPNPEDSKIITSTPFGATPAKKRRFNLSLRSRREAESKDSAFSESRSISTDKSSQNNPQSHQKTGENLEDSITRDLDSMFGGVEDRGVDPGGFMMTQEVVDILKSSQSPPGSPKGQEMERKSPKIVKTRGRKTKKNQQKSTNVMGKSARLASGDDVDSQENHLSNAKGQKCPKNVLVSMSSEDEPILGFDKAVSIAGPSTPRKSSRLQGKGQKIKENSEDLLKTEIWGISSRPLSSPASSISSQVSARGPGTSGKGLESPGRSKVVRIPKISLRKIVDKKSVDDSEDEDSDFESINKMADGFLTSSGVGKSPPRLGRGRKTVVESRIPKMQHKMEKKDLKKNLITSKSKRQEDGGEERSLRGRLNEAKSVASSNTGRSLGVILGQDDEVERSDDKSKNIEEDVKTSRGRGRKKVAQVAEEEEEEEEEEVARKRGRGRKNEEEDEGMRRSKRARRDNSGESSPGAESQEVRRILRGAEEAPGDHRGQQERLEDVVRGKKRRLEEVASSPSRAVRSRSLLEEHRTQQVLFTGVKEQVDQDSVAALGGIVTDHPHEATILVTDKVRRTVKFFCAISRGIPIVSIAWLQSSVAAKKFLDPSKYILHDPASETRYKFNLGRSLNRAREGKLLEGRTIVLTSKLSGPSIPDLKTMVQTAGGKSLVRAPAIWPPDSVIVSCPEDLPKVKKMLSRAKNVRVHVVDIEFLLSGLLRQELNYEEFALKVS
ncbi:mediator of DNA damage checkpoint protein 1 [Diachasma alloeum]|uniref:mediator of DNA damage checkpoint protein 1 n=1 Tax=Diachasma alloeum TaxID=454923 RepID=UPI00073836E2|nr:mediator of DNA damage checkpoint protein 1 [Diachasma alloeum]